MACPLGSGTIFRLHKHDSRLDPANYRPITLMSVIGKLFGVVVNTRLCSSEAMDTVADEQGGVQAEPWHTGPNFHHARNAGVEA